MKLEGQAALVTGGGKGIGRATCIALAKEGAAVAVNYSRSEAEADDVVRVIEAMGGKAFAIKADVRDEAEVRMMVAATVTKFGRLDILVNNAGWTRRTPHDQLDLLTEELLDRTINTNLKGPLYCIRAAVPHMRKVGGGLVVNITSVAGMNGNGSSIIYGGAKAALAVMSKSLARALAPDIRVNCVAPGFVDTGFVMPPGGDAATNASKRVHSKGIMTPEDIAGAVLFFATEGDRLTAEEIVVDGGIMKLGARVQ